MDGYARMKGICNDLPVARSKLDKRCANRFEILVAVIYLYANRDLSVVYNFLEFSMGLTHMINNNNPNGISKYHPWKQTTKCDKGQMIMERKCKSGDCQIVEKKAKCPVVCKDGYRQYYDDNGGVVTEQCNTVSKCDKHGLRTITGPLLNTTEVCPDDLYENELVYDTSCKTGKVHVYKICKDKDQCEDIIWDSYPCSDEYPTPDDFVNMDEDDKWDIYEKLRNKLGHTKMNWDVDVGYADIYPELYH